MMRIRPYRTLENMIEGAVITFMDITDIKRRRQELSDAHALAEAIVETIPLPLLVLDATFHVLAANHSFYTTFQAQATETVGQVLFDLGKGQWNISELRHALTQVLPDTMQKNTFAMTHDFETIGQHTFQVNVRRISSPTNSFDLLLLAFSEGAKT